MTTTRTERPNCQTPPRARLPLHVHSQPCQNPTWLSSTLRAAMPRTRRGACQDTGCDVVASAARRGRERSKRGRAQRSRLPSSKAENVRPWIASSFRHLVYSGLEVTIRIERVRIREELFVPQNRPDTSLSTRALTPWLTDRIRTHQTFANTYHPVG